MMTTSGFHAVDWSVKLGAPSSLVMAANRDKISRTGDYVLHPKYLTQTKRDPFVPLVTETETESEVKRAKRIRQQAASQRQARKIKRFTEFGKEVKSLGLIPVELYREIAKRAPVLYADLDHYSRLFREKTGLRKLTIEDYLKTVGVYKRLINKANEFGKRLAKTPLQTDLKSLRLVGIVWGGAKPVALVETSGHKGHTVRQGMLVGSRFGVVQSISHDYITVLERDRDFRGDVKSRIRKIQLIKNLKAKREKS
ncbi:MAG: pilus assembly protein PilP [Nitrospinales bacterium]